MSTERLLKARQSYKHYIVVLFLLWLTVFASFFALIINHEMNLIQEKFHEIHDKIYRHISDSIKVYEVSIESFASVLATEPENDYKDARRFAKQIRSHYPDIYMLEIAKRVSREDRNQLEEDMQNAGYSDFVIHTFGYDSDRKSHISPIKDVYYPIVFIEPELKESMGVLGLDLSESSSLLKDALQRSFDKRTHVASKPFNLIESNRGYILYREVNPTKDESRLELTPKQKLYALLVVDASKLIPEWAYNTPGLSFSLHYPDVSVAQNGNLINFSDNTEKNNSSSFLSTEFSESSDLKSQSQPFKLTSQYIVQWNDFNLASLMVYLLVAAATLPIVIWLSTIFYRKKVQCTREHEKNYHLANYDLLTGLPNKIHAKELFYQKSNLLRQKNKKLAVLFIDLNEFKQTNDQYGHKVGDRLLQHVAKRLRAVLRDSDTLARLHGDEFVIFISDFENLENIEVVTGNIKSAFKNPFNLNGTVITIGLSIGVSIFPEDGVSFDELLDKSDKSMYEDKKKGRVSIIQFHA